MKNLLLVVPWLPFPLKSGGHQAIFNSIKAIASDVNIYITYQKFDISNSEIEGFLLAVGGNVKVLPYYELPIKRNFFQVCFHSFHVFLWHVKERLTKCREKSVSDDSILQGWISEMCPLPENYLKHINEIIECYDIDIVQCEMLGNISVVLNLPNTVKKIFVHHELGFVRRDLIIVNNKNLSDSLRAHAFQLLSKQIELRLLNKYDIIVTLSEIDKQKLLAAGVTVPVLSSFSIVRTSLIDNPVLETNKVLSFVGPQFHTPNLIGLIWFLKECWGQLKKEDADYQLKIIGYWSDETSKELSQKYSGITFMGYVDNLQDALKGTIMIVPITIGSGIRMKILEAASMGIPFVSTSIGAEGLPFKSGENCYISDNPKEFVRDIILLQDYQRRIIFSDKAKKLVKDNYSIESLRKNRMPLYEQ